MRLPENHALRSTFVKAGLRRQENGGGLLHSWRSDALEPALFPWNRGKKSGRADFGHGRIADTSQLPISSSTLPRSGSASPHAVNHAVNLHQHPIPFGLVGKLHRLLRVRHRLPVDSHNHIAPRATRLRRLSNPASTSLTSAPLNGPGCWNCWRASLSRSATSTPSSCSTFESGAGLESSPGRRPVHPATSPGSR